jgi:hypothetical protein
MIGETIEKSDTIRMAALLAKVRRGRASLDKQGRGLKKLLDRGFVSKGEDGEYIVTDDGEMFMESVRRTLR